MRTTTEGCATMAQAGASESILDQAQPPMPRPSVGRSNDEDDKQHKQTGCNDCRVVCHFAHAYEEWQEKNASCQAYKEGSSAKPAQAAGACQQ